MRMQVRDIERQLARQDQRLPKAPRSAGSRVSPQITQPLSKDAPICAPLPHPPPCAKHAQGFLVQILGKILHWRADLRMHRMHPRIRWMAEGKYQNIESALLEGGDLLGNEGFGQPRIALEYKGNATSRGSNHQLNRYALRPAWQVRLLRFRATAPRAVPRLSVLREAPGRPHRRADSGVVMPSTPQP